MHWALDKVAHFKKTHDTDAQQIWFTSVSSLVPFGKIFRKLWKDPSSREFKSFVMLVFYIVGYIVMCVIQQTNEADEKDVSVFLMWLAVSSLISIATDVNVTTVDSNKVDFVVDCVVLVFICHGMWKKKASQPAPNQQPVSPPQPTGALSPSASVGGRGRSTTGRVVRRRSKSRDVGDLGNKRQTRSGRSLT
jgi:hypothetical protein